MAIATQPRFNRKKTNKAGRHMRANNEHAHRGVWLHLHRDDIRTCFAKESDAGTIPGIIDASATDVL